MVQGWGELKTLYRGGDGTIKVGYYDIRAAMMAHHMLRKDSMDIRYATARDGIGREGEGAWGLSNQSLLACSRHLVTFARKGNLCACQSLLCAGKAFHEEVHCQQEVKSVHAVA